MGDLGDYESKRDFSKSPEPRGRGTRKRKRSAPRFVIQEHAARWLHYDFRLEVDGVLKSWAVPRGPSTDPSEKRLAVQVEDHPLDYADFEGHIGSGYGAGRVIVWDAGTWRSLTGTLAEAIERAGCTFRLQGEKLHGRWHLQRTRGGDKQAVAPDQAPRRGRRRAPQPRQHAARVGAQRAHRRRHRRLSHGDNAARTPSARPPIQPGLHGEPATLCAPWPIIMAGRRASRHGRPVCSSHNFDVAHEPRVSMTVDSKSYARIPSMPPPPERGVAPRHPVAGPKPAHRRLLIAGPVVAMVSVLVALLTTDAAGLPLRDPDHVAGRRLVLVLGLVALLIVLDVLVRARRRSRTLGRRARRSRASGASVGHSRGESPSAAP